MEWPGFRVGVVGWMVGLVVSAGCAKPPADAALRLAETKKNEVELEHQLSQLEERLLGAQAAVHLWQEIGRRHEQVSVVACENAGRHLEDVARHLEHQDPRQRLARRAPSAKLSLSRSSMGGTLTPE